MCLLFKQKPGEEIVQIIPQWEGLRNTIITHVKQSTILNTDGSEYMNPGQISNAIYEELGSKIMGQISDEVWKVIRSNDSVKSDIRGTIEAIYNRLVNPEESKGDQIGSSSAKVQMINRNDENVPPVSVSLCDTNVPSDNEIEVPPRFVQYTHHSDNEFEVPPRFVQYTQHSNGDHKEPNNEQPCLSSNGELHGPSDAFHMSDVVSPGFGDHST